MRNKASCNICGNNSFLRSKSFRGTTEKYKNYFYDYALCARCGSLVNTISEEVNYASYPTGKSISKLKVNRLIKLLKISGTSKNNFLLDYGCGKGALATALKKKGYDIKGYEPFNDNYSQTLTAERKYSLIYLTHVFEHLLEYGSFFRDLELVAEPGAKVITIHPSSTRIKRLDPSDALQCWTIHAPFHKVIPSDKATISLFSEKGYELESFFPYDYQRSGIIDNNLISAELFKCLGWTKERLLNAGFWKKRLKIIEFPLRFFKLMFLTTKDPLVSTFVFKKK